MAGISREREAQAVNKILSAYTETTKQSATTVAGLESKKARATNGSNVTQKNNDNGEVVSKQTAGTNQDNNSSNHSITNTTNDSNSTKSNKPSGSETENNKTKSLKRCIMLILSITLHNIPEGLAVGVAFGGIAYGIEGATLSSALMIALGIGIQNFPEGTAVSVPLRREGLSRKKAFFFGQLSGLVEPISGVLGALLVLKVRTLLPFLLAFAAGAMIYVVVEELIPESQTNKRKELMALFTLIGFSIMMILDVALG